MSEDVAEWHEVPEGRPKVKTARFACGFIPHLFRKRFFMNEFVNIELIKKGFVPQFFR
jgi:hypothetical protein